MKLNEHERPGANVAGLMSPVQQDEMKLLLAGKWPPLRPLPVFKLETQECRISVDFDKTRGEWLCRKTSLASRTVQEMRGGLPEIIRALPHDQAAVFLESIVAEQRVQELDKDAGRRLRAMLEWRENYENGAQYSGLRNYLSESQQHEIEEIIRLTLTARQLQFCPKNIAYVFDALSKAGGKLATLMEIAQRKRMGQQTEPPATAEESTPDPERGVPIENFIPAALERIPDAPMGSISPEREPPSAHELMVRASSEASEIVTPGIVDANPPSLVEDLPEREIQHAPVPDFGLRVRARKVQPSADRIENPPAHRRGLELSGLHVAAFAAVFLFAVISLPIALTVGRGPLGQWIQDTQKSILAIHPASPASPDHPDETASQASTPSSLNTQSDTANFSDADKRDEATLPQEKSVESTRDSQSFTKVYSKDSNSSPAIEPNPPAAPEGNPAHNDSAGPIARNIPPLASPKPTLSPKALGPISGAPIVPAPHKLAPATRQAARRSPPSTILVTAPAHGSKPFRVSFPEKPIAASSSFAMTSELSVLVPPQPGPAASHRPARLQSGELVSFVWPNFPRPGDRYGSVETVKVRTIIGKLGQVLDVKLVSGSHSLLPATVSAIRQWRYKPTLMNKKPVQVQQDVTIEFRPSPYLSQVHNQPPSHN